MKTAFITVVALSAGLMWFSGRPDAATMSTSGCPFDVAPFREPPDDRRGPDGFYGSTTDMVQSIEGTPCDESCKTASYRRWNPNAKSSFERDRR